MSDMMADTKVTLKQGDQSVTVERKPTDKMMQSMTPNALLGGMVGGNSPTPVADDQQINVTSGEYVVNQPAAQKYAGLLEDINNEGKQMLAAGGWTGDSMMPKGYNLGGKISKIYNEGYTAPGQAYVIAKSKGYNQGGAVMPDLNNPDEILQSPIFKKLVKQSQDYGYDAANLPTMIFEHPQFGRLFDTPEKQEALLKANATAQTTAPNYAMGGRVNYNTGGLVDQALAESGQSKYHYDIYGPSAKTKEILARLEGPVLTGDDPVGEIDSQVVTPKIGLEEDVQAIASDKPLTPVPGAGGADTAPKGTPGVLPNKAYDFILEKSRGLAAGKGFGGAKLGAKEYVDELYKPAGGYAKPGSTSAGSGSKRVFNLEWRDPKTGQLEVRAGRRNANGDFELQDKSGNWVPAHQVTKTNDIRVAPRSADPGVEDGAGGIPNADSFNEATGIPTFTFNRESEGKAYGYTVRAIAADDGLTKLEGQIAPTNLSSLWGGLAQWASRNANAGVTSAVINSVIADSGLQQYSREMTKFLQAILRNDTGAAYTGTEIADYLSAFGIAPGTEMTPEILKSFQNGRKQEIATSIGRTGKAGPYLSGLLEGKYPTPGLGGNTGGVTSKDGKAGTTSSGVGWKIK